MPQYTFDVNAAMKAGYTPDQIQQYIDQQKAQGNQYNLTQTPQATPQQSQQPAQPAQPKNSWADWLPTVGGIVGGIAGAAVPVLGETGVGEIGGSAAGSGLGETAKELIEGKPLNAGDIAGQTALGGVSAGVGVGAGKVLGGVLGKLGEGEAINGLNLTRLQQNALKIKNGESVAETLTKHDLTGANAESLSNGIGKVQNMFDSIAKNNNVPIDQNAFLTHATTALNALKSSSVPSDQALAPQVEEALGNVMDKIANGKVTTLADLNAERQAFDNATKDSQFGSSPWGVNRTVGDILRSTAYDTADNSGAVGPNGESLKLIGQNLRKLYNISNIADKRVGQGNSAGVLSVSNMLLGGLGALAGSPAGPVGSMAGYAATTGARKLLATQPVAKVLSNTLSGAAKGLATPAGMAGAAALGSGAANALSITPQGTSDNSNNNNTNQQNFQSNTLPSSPQGSFGNNSTINSTGSQANPLNPSTPDAVPDSFLKGYTVNGVPLDDATRNLIYQIVNYKLDPSKMTSLRNNERERIINLASQADPSYDSSQFPVKQKLRQDYTSGTTGKNIQAFNTAIQHLYLLNQVSRNLGNTSFTPYNAFKNNISQMTGNPQVTNFNQVANAVSGEIAKIFKSNGATDAEIENIQKGLSSDMSPAQLQGNVAYLIQLMGGKLDALNSQYTQAMGKPADFQIVDPKSQQILDSLQGSNSNNLPSSLQ